MARDWINYRLGDICYWQGGYSFKNKDYAVEGGDQYIVFRMGNIQKGGGINRSASKVFINKKSATKLNRYLLKKNDLVLCMTDMKASMNLLGHTALIDENDTYILNQRVGRITVKDPTKVDHRYLFYYTNSPGYINYLHGVAHSGVQVNISTEAILESHVKLPPLPTQRKIAAILSAYDDLIENNTRRIKILEEMAQAIYREWFVRYRFPGHEGVKLVDSGTELGMVPEGWEVNPIGEVIEILGGGTPSTQVSDYWENGDINWFCPKDLTASGTMFIGDSPKKITLFGLQKSSARMFPAYSVMMTSRATLGVTSINTSPACTNQGFITCVPNEKLSAYQIYFWIADNLEKIISVASGATFKEITKTTFRKFLVILAPKEINDYFIELMTPLGKQIENLQSKNSNLHVTRDLLLPRLVSGELDVSEMEIPTA